MRTAPNPYHNIYCRVNDGQYEMLHRCLECWATSPAKDYDNGFVAGDRPYPHAAGCKQTGKF